MLKMQEDCFQKSQTTLKESTKLTIKYVRKITFNKENSL